MLHILDSITRAKIEEAMWGTYWCHKCGEPMHDCKQFGCEMD